MLEAWPGIHARAPGVDFGPGFQACFSGLDFRPAALAWTSGRGAGREIQARFSGTVSGPGFPALAPGQGAAPARGPTRPGRPEIRAAGERPVWAGRAFFVPFLCIFCAFFAVRYLKIRLLGAGPAQKNLQIRKRGAFFVPFFVHFLCIFCPRRACARKSCF